MASKWAKIATKYEAVDTVPAHGGKWKTIALGMEETRQTKDPEKSLGWDEVLERAIGNIPTSAVETGKNLVAPILHPAKTMEGIGALANDLSQGMPASPMPAMPGGFTPFEKDGPKVDNGSLKAVVEGMKNRYGSVDNFKKTLSEDPIGVMADIASALMTGGLATKAVGALSGAEKVAAVGEKIATAGAKLDPVYGLAKTAALGTIKTITPKTLPSRMWKSAAKLSTTFTQAQRAKIAETALRYDVTSTISGVDKVRKKIDSLNSTISQLVERTDLMPGAKIPVHRLFDEFKQLERDFMENSGSPLKARQAIRSVEKEITRANRIIGRRSLSPTQAQKMKQTIYKELEKSYNKLMALPAKTEAQMAVARAAKEGLEDLIPEIKALNATEGELIDLHNAIERSASRIGNRDIMGIGVPIKGSLGAMVSGPSGATAGLLLGVLDTPSVKSKLSVVLNRLKRDGIKINKTAALSRLSFVHGGKISEIKYSEDNQEQ